MDNNHQSYKADLIQNEIKAAESLLSTLKKEFEALNKPTTPEEITSFATQKEQQLRIMENASQQRISQIPAADPQLATEPLKSLWQKLLTLAKNCHHQNQLNGGIINTTKRHVEQATAILHGKQPSSELRYGSTGETVSENQRRSLAKA